MRIAIIEDEINNRELLVHMIENYVSDVEMVGTASSVAEGKMLISSEKPDLVLLDVEIVGGSGFEVLDECKKHSCGVIFTTGYEQYAIQAIKNNAIDYILKPIDIDELKEAIEKARGMLKSTSASIDFLQKHLVNESKAVQSIVLSSMNKDETVALSAISHVQADDNGCFFYMMDGSRKVTSLKISFFEDILESDQFMRIHRSFIINKDAVVSHDLGRSISVLLQNDISLKVAYRRRGDFLDWLGASVR